MTDFKGLRHQQQKLLTQPDSMKTTKILFWNLYCPISKRNRRVSLFLRRSHPMITTSSKLKGNITFGLVLSQSQFIAGVITGVRSFLLSTNITISSLFALFLTVNCFQWPSWFKTLNALYFETVQRYSWKCFVCKNDEKMDFESLWGIWTKFLLLQSP